VPATQRYCAGDFRTWDPKITTFPGLYVLGAAYAWTAHLLLGWAGVTLVRAHGGRGLPGCGRALAVPSPGVCTAHV
jgi:hypothetical protein